MALIRPAGTSGATTRDSEKNPPGSTMPCRLLGPIHGNSPFKTIALLLIFGSWLRA
jgi:hypothetical protein